MTCTQCGTQNPDDGTFCVGCGQALQAAPAPQYAPPAPQYAAPAVDDEAKDAEDNKVMGILAYFGPLALIPWLTKKDSPFAQFHGKQGMNLLVLWVGYVIVNIILSAIKITKTDYYWGVPVETKATPWFILLIIWLLSIGVLVLAIIGIINAVKGLKKELPLIGKIKIFK